MTNRFYLKCDVCGCVTLLRFQMGWIKTTPVRIYCGECNILIDGYVETYPENTNIKYEFNNAELVNETTPQFYLEGSGELLVPKPMPINDFSDTMQPPPFFRNLWAMGESGDELAVDSYNIFRNNIEQMIYLIGNDWPSVRRINELIINKKYNYLGEQLLGYFENNKFENEHDYVQGIGNLVTLFYSPIRNKEKINSFRDELEKAFQDTIVKNEDGLKKFILSTHYNQIDIFFRDIVDIMEHFNKIFNHFIPIYGSEFHKNDDMLQDNYQITTISFEDIKTIYVDMYELIVEMYILPVALNNIFYRSNYDSMKKKSKINTLNQFTKLPKAKRLDLLNETEVFGVLVATSLDKNLRNSIAHKFYKVDGFNQYIQYKKDNTGMSLINICKLTLDTFYKVLEYYDLIIFIKKLRYRYKGSI